MSNDLDGCEISILQFLQFCVILALYLRNGSCQWNGIVCLLLVGKQNPQRRSQERACDNDDGKHNEKRCAAAQRDKCVYQLFRRFCRRFAQLLCRCNGCSCYAGIALLEHLSLCVLRRRLSRTLCINF